jgi:hypothetical protein
MLGNVLFFFSTGFLLFNQIKDGFLLWFYKKINRIYLSLWIFLFALILLGIQQFSLESFFYPTD